MSVKFIPTLPEATEFYKGPESGAVRVITVSESASTRPDLSEGLDSIRILNTFRVKDDQPDPEYVYGEGEQKNWSIARCKSSSVFRFDP